MYLYYCPHSVRMAFATLCYCNKAAQDATTQLALCRVSCVACCAIASCDCGKVNIMMAGTDTKCEGILENAVTVVAFSLPCR